MSQTKAETASMPGRNPPLSGILLQPLNPQTQIETPDREVSVIQHSRSPGLHLSLAVAPPSPVLPSTKAVATSTPVGKIYSMFISDPALPLKPLATCRLHRDTPIYGLTFKTNIVTVLPNFLETEKIKQNEKTEEFVSNERQKNP